MKVLNNKVLAFAAAILLLMSCASELDQASSAQAIGYLAVPSLSVDCTVDQINPTKAMAVPTDFAPDVSEMQIKVTAGGSTVYDGKGLWEAPIMVPVGNYKVEVTYGSNNELGSPYFHGTYEGSLSRPETVTPEIDVELKNSLVAVSLTSDMSGHFIPENVTFKRGTESYEPLEWNTEDNCLDYVFVPSGEAIDMIVTGKNSIEGDAFFEYTLSSPAPATAYEVICGRDETNWPTITFGDVSPGALEDRVYFNPAIPSENISAGKVVYQIKVGESEWIDAETSEVTVDENTYILISGLTNDVEYSIKAKVGNVESEVRSFTPRSLATYVKAGTTAEHTTNASKELNGTRVESVYTVEDIPTLVAELITLTASGSTTKSSHSNSTLSKSGETEIEHKNNDGWPYIPQGDYYYSSTVTCTFPGNTSVTRDLEALNFTVHSPVFTVRLLDGSYASFDKYSAGDIDGANGCNAETLYNLGATWTISPELMANANYSKTLQYYAGETKLKEYTVTKNQHSVPEFSGFSWGSHKVKAKFTFDGVESESDPRTHHITGLPYTADPPKNSSWESNYNSVYNSFEWAEDYVKMEGVSRKQTITSSEFHIPSSINVNLGVNVDLYSIAVIGIWAIPELRCRVGGQQVISKDGVKGDTNWIGSGNTTINYSGSGNGTLTTSGKTVEIENAYTMTEAYIKVYSVSVTYRK